MTAKKSVTGQLAALEAAVGQARHQQRMAETRVQNLKARLEETADVIANCYADGDDAGARAARETADRISATDLVDAKDRLEGARIAVAQADNRATAYARDHDPDLMRERATVHARTRQERDRLLDELVQLGARDQEEIGETQRVQRRLARNDRVDGLDPQTKDLIRTVKRARQAAPPQRERVPA